MEKSRPTTAQRINQLFFRKAVRFAKHVIANKEWKRQWQRNAQLKKGEVFRDAIKVFMVELGRKKEKVILQPDRVVFKSMRWFPRVKPRGYVLEESWNDIPYNFEVFDWIGSKRSGLLNTLCLN